MFHLCVRLDQASESTGHACKAVQHAAMSELAFDTSYCHPGSSGGVAGNERQGGAAALDPVGSRLPLMRDFFLLDVRPQHGKCC